MICLAAVRRGLGKWDPVKILSFARDAGTRALLFTKLVIHVIYNLLLSFSILP